VRGSSLIELSVPQTTHTVYARPETSDLASFEGVFGDAWAVDLPTEPRLVFDLGANVGYTSVYFALRWPGARVVAVEPVPSNVALLRRNVSAFPQIDVVEGGAWPRPGRLAVEDAGKGYWGMRVREARDSGRVRAVTIPELMERAGADWIDFVKIDIEGSELELFSDETEWLGAVGALMLELHDRYRPGCRDAVERAIARSGVAFRALYQGGDVVLIRDH
jgi:FkbM family methyltransferase